MQVSKTEVPYTTLHFFNLLEILMSWFSLLYHLSIWLCLTYGKITTTFNENYHHLPWTELNAFIKYTMGPLVLPTIIPVSLSKTNLTDEFAFAWGRTSPVFPNTFPIWPTGTLLPSTVCGGFVWAGHPLNTLLSGPDVMRLFLKWVPLSNWLSQGCHVPTGHVSQGPRWSSRWWQEAQGTSPAIQWLCHYL